MLIFDANITRQLEIAYQGSDVTQRRRTSFDALLPKPGETILDIGCGNGLLTLELARAVGDGGLVIGVDPSDDMRNAAAQRCKDFSNVQFLNGSAGDLPLKIASVDKAASVQVFEYVKDLEKAASEVHRVLKPGGTLVVGDIHFDSVAWFSDHPDRMKRMLDAWDGHFVERCIPAVLPPILSNAGFVVESITPATICDNVFRPDGLARMMIHLMEPYAVNNGLMSAEEASAWSKEQMDLAKDGRFFFSLTYFVIKAYKK